jgi:hypothetical protein
MTRWAARKRYRRVEKEHLEIQRGEIESLLRDRFPAARVTWRDRGQTALRVEGAPGGSVDQLEIKPRWHNLGAAGFGSGRREWVLNEVEAELQAERSRRISTAVSAERRVRTWFDFLQLLVPKRIADEEIGDALEDNVRLYREGRPKWWIYLRTARAVFFMLLHSVGEIWRSVSGKIKA